MLFRSGPTWLLLAALLLLASCGSDAGSPLSDGDADADPDAEAPADGETETDVDGEAETSPEGDEPDETECEAPTQGCWELGPEHDSYGLYGPFDDLPGLSETIRSLADEIGAISTWSEDTTHETPGEEVSESSRLGYHAVGNGMAFAFVGTRYPRSTLHSLVGPGYQRADEGYFADTTLFVEEEGSVLPHARDQAYRPVEGQVILTRTSLRTTPEPGTEGIELFTLSFAPRPESDTEIPKARIIQFASVINSGESARAGLLLRLQDYARAEAIEGGEGACLLQSRSGQRLRICPLAPGFAAGDDAGKSWLRSPAFDLASGEERTFLVVYDFFLDGGEVPPVPSELSAGWRTDLTATLNAWRAWHGKGARMETGCRRLTDLMEQIKGEIKVQQAFNGALCPMSHYTSFWLRDSYGPTRMFTRLGYTEDALAIADYLYGGASVGGSIGNAMPADRPIPDPLPEVDWLGKEMFTGRLRGEGPSHIPLIYDLLWRHGGTEGLSRACDRFPFLLHTLSKQTITEEGLLYFSGDETFRPQYGYNTGLGLSYVFEENAYSANSGFLFVRAAEALAKIGQACQAPAEQVEWLAEQADRVRTATEERYWLSDLSRYSPLIFMADLTPDRHVAEDVNTMPVWTGYLAPTDERAVQNMESSLEILSPEGFLQNDPNIEDSYFGFSIGHGIMTGMTPAYFLYNAASLQMPEAAGAFNALSRYVSPSGEYPEVGVHYEPYRALSPLYNKTGGDGETWARHRQWEGSVSLEALWQYLLGYEFDLAQGTVRFAPHWPAPIGNFHAFGLPYGDLAFEASFNLGPDGLTFWLREPDGAAAKGLSQIVVEFAPPFGVEGRVRVDGEEAAPGDLERREGGAHRVASIRVRLTPTGGERWISIHAPETK